MLPGIQITFMIFCWATILGCLASVIFSVIDMIQDRRQKKKKDKYEQLLDEIRELKNDKNNTPPI